MHAIATYEIQIKYTSTQQETLQNTLCIVLETGTTVARFCCTLWEALAPIQTLLQNLSYSWLVFAVVYIRTNGRLITVRLHAQS